MNKQEILDEIIGMLKAKCRIYRVDYEANEGEIWKLLAEKVEATGEPISSLDCKGVCELIAEREYIANSKEVNE